MEEMNWFGERVVLCFRSEVIVKPELNWTE